MDGMDPIDSFVFDEYACIHQGIGPIPIVEHDLFVADRTVGCATSSLSITLDNCRAAKGANKFFLCGPCDLRGSKCKAQSTPFGRLRAAPDCELHTVDCITRRRQQLQCVLSGSRRPKKQIFCGANSLAVQFPPKFF